VGEGADQSVWVMAASAIGAPGMAIVTPSNIRSISAPTSGGRVSLDP
jgi:hypothetical protein